MIDGGVGVSDMYKHGNIFSSYTWAELKLVLLNVHQFVFEKSVDGTYRDTCFRYVNENQI